MKTNGLPVLSDRRIMSAILSLCTSPAAPPATVKSWLARCTRRPSMVAHPVTTPSAGISLLGHTKIGSAMLGKLPDLLEAVLVHQSGDALARCQLAGRMLASMRSLPPPSSTALRLAASSSILSLIVFCFISLIFRSHSCSWILQSELKPASNFAEPRLPGALSHSA